MIKSLSNNQNVTMSSTYSIKDINFIVPLYNYLGIFLVTPWYDFQKNDVYRPNWCKLYGFLLITVNFLWVTYTVMDTTIDQMSPYFLLSQKFIFWTCYINLLTINILTILKSCFCDGRNWKRLFQNFKYLDKNLYNKENAEDCLLNNFYCRLVIEHAFFAFVMIYQLYVWSKFFDRSIVKIACISSLKETYYLFLVILLLRGLVQAFKSRYEDLNEKLANVKKEIKIRDSLRQINKEYRVLGETVEIFNNIFGYQILLIIFHGGLALVNCLNISFVSYTIAGRHLSQHLLLSNISLLVLISVSDCFVIVAILYIFLL